MDHSSSRAERTGVSARQNGSAGRDRPVAQAVRTGMRAGRRWVTVVLACSALVLGGCTSPEPEDAGPGPGGAEPDVAESRPDRPVVDLRFQVAPDLATVAGREVVEFTPDLDTCELVFRSWPNKPATSRAGTSLTVSTVQVDCFATASPLLAWERGRGWERGPAVPVIGETAVSEDFLLDSMEVVAPSGYEVLGTGAADGTEDRQDGTTAHRFTAPAVRDVAVAVGDLAVTERTIDGGRVRLGLDREVDEADGEAWLDQIEASNRGLVDLLGPFPYDDLWVVVLSAQTSGIEFPGAIQFGDVDPDERRGLVTHELAHMWFYGLVGNDQGEHPWLDESFSTFAQLVADGDEQPFAHLAAEDSPPVGGSMTYWASEVRRPNSTYYDTVYTLGGAALVEAREQAGEEVFDAALADYVAANAHSIATPDDVREAFADLPEVLGVLRG